jgi:proton-dependent oligopeptide transporter, POT family
MFKALKNYFSEFKVLAVCPREFWILNLVINFFEMIGWFSFITVLTLYLTQNVGFDDEWTGNVVGLFSLGISVIMFFSGFIIDSIGIKKALLISMAILIPTRFIVGITGPIENRYLEKNLDVEEARALILQDGLHQSAFTRIEADFQAAQADLLAEAGALGAAGLTAEEILSDSKMLRTEMAGFLRSSPLVLQQYGADELDAKLKDGDAYKAMIVAEVAARSVLADRYFIDMLSGSDEERNNKVIGVVKLFPDLRAKYSIQDFLKLLVILTLIPIAFGEAVMVPAIYAALRRYTNKRTSGTGFNFQYLTMNIAAVLAGVSIDLLRVPLGNESIFLFGALLAIVCTVGVLFLRTHIEVLDDGTVIETAPAPDAKREMPWTIFWDVVQEKAFWRFLMFILLLIGVRLVFTHQFMVMPKYYTRVMGHDAPIGLLNAINPAIITIGLVLFIPVIARFSVFRLILVGTTISALSVTALCIPGKFFTGLGWSLESGYLALILAQIIVFAIGEVIWSPRLQEYTVTIAPKGREGSYLSFSVLPMFLAKPLNGVLSGRLLAEYCPEGVLDEISAGTRTYSEGPEMMWIIFALIAISSPILIFLLRNVIRPDESHDDDEDESGDGGDGAPPGAEEVGETGAGPDPDRVETDQVERPVPIE